MIEQDKIFEEFSKYFQDKYVNEYNDLKELKYYNYIDIESAVIDLVRTAFLKFTWEHDLGVSKELLTVIIIFSSTILDEFKEYKKT